MRTRYTATLPSGVWCATAGRVSQLPGARATCAGRPARWPMGTPTPPGGGDPGGTRTASGSAVEVPPAEPAGTSRTVRFPRPRTEGSCEKSNLRSVLSLTSALSPCAHSSTPHGSVVTYEVAHQSANEMAAQRPLPENAGKSSGRKYLQSAEVLDGAIDLARIFRAFVGGRVDRLR